MAVITKNQLRGVLARIKAILDGLADYISDERTVTLPVANWQTDNNAEYPAYQDITVSGITTDDRADVIFDENVFEAAATCGVSSVSTVTAANTVRIRAVEAPEVALTATVWIIYGKGN